MCEGNFGNGDATLYLYKPEKDSVYGDLYKSANNQPLGDVFQGGIGRMEKNFNFGVGRGRDDQRYD